MGPAFVYPERTRYSEMIVGTYGPLLFKPTLSLSNSTYVARRLIFTNSFPDRIFRLQDLTKHSKAVLSSLYF